MTTITKTISNTVRLYGIEPHNKWGSLVWGRDTWAQQDVQWLFNKNLAENIDIESQNSFKVIHLISESTTLSTTISRQFPARTSDMVSVSSRIASVYRVNNGWFVQQLEKTNLLDIPVNLFTEVSNAVTSWTQVTPTSTTWISI